METNLDRITVALMLNMRRIVRDEFGILVSLQEESAPLTLYRYGLASRHRKLQELAVELAERFQPLASRVAAEAGQRIYRGQVVQSEPATPATTVPPRPRSRRVYRGQVLKD